MKLKNLFLFIIMTLLAACSTGQAPVQVNSVISQPLQSQPTTAPASEPTLAPLVDTPTLASTSAPKPPLAKDAWMQMPVVPNGVSAAMRAVYQRGLAQGCAQMPPNFFGDERREWVKQAQ